MYGTVSVTIYLVPQQRRAAGETSSELHVDARVTQFSLYKHKY